MGLDKQIEIVIPHHYRFDLTKNCLDSIPDSNIVYLVDDTQVGEARQYCELRRFVKWIRTSIDISLPMAINIGAENVKEKWFVVCDNDVMFDRVAWKQISEAIEKAEKNNASLCVSQMMFVVWIVKTDVFRKLQYDDYFAPAGGEDEDFLLRFCKAGYKWIHFGCKVWHQEGGHHSKGTIYSEGVQTEKFIKKHGFKPHSEDYNKIVKSGYIHC